MLAAPGNVGIERDGVECLPDGDIVAIRVEDLGEKEAVLAEQADCLPGGVAGGSRKRGS